MAKGRFILAHDLGTTGNKATLYDPDGVLLNSAFVPYRTDYPRTNWAEQNPNDWWEAVCRSTHELLVGYNKADVGVISFSGQMMGCLPVDRHATPLRKAIIWADQRSVQQASSLLAALGEEKVYNLTGHRISPAYSVEKIMWVQDNQPDVYKGAHKFLHAKDYIVAKLTGKFVTDYSDASGMNLYDITNYCWSEEILRAAGLDPDKLPVVHSSYDVVGEVTNAVSDEVGLMPGTPVVIGAGDGVCAGVGAGVVLEGRAYNYIGSSSWVAMVTPKPILDPERKTFNWLHMNKGMYMPCGTMQSAGASYQWAKETFGQREVEAGNILGVSPYDLLNLQIEKRRTTGQNLIYLPYLMGERSPHWNPNARGAFIGLTLRHTREDMLRAVLEGVAFNLRIIIECFENVFEFDELRVIGGGAKGRVWRQILADIFGKRVLLPKYISEATSLGAAVAGGVGVGLIDDPAKAEFLNPVVEVEEPSDGSKEYDRLYPIFQDAYYALLKTFEQLAEFGS